MEELCKLKSNAKANPISKTTASFFLHQMTVPTAMRRIWTANWSQAMGVRYCRILPYNDVGDTASALLACSRTLRGAMSDIFEERKYLLRGTEYRRLCSLLEWQSPNSWSMKNSYSKHARAWRYRLSLLVDPLSLHMG